MSNEETLRKLALQVRNWGKWGADDEIGTLNYITPEKIAQASQLVTAGKVFALGIPLQRNGPQSGTRQRFNPIHTMFRDGGHASAVRHTMGQPRPRLRFREDVQWLRRHACHQ